MTILHGVDASFDDLSDAEAKRLRARGIDVFFQCLWTGNEQPPPRVTNLRTAHRNGFILGGYISVTGSRSGYEHAQSGRNGMPQDLWDALVLVPIDVELDGIPNTTIRDAVEAVATMDKRRAVYTSYNCWVNKQGNPMNFTDCLLWNAYWDRDPDADFPSLPFGGWRPDQVVGEQWSGRQTVEGVHVDRDTFVKELLVPAPPSGRPLTREQCINIWRAENKRVGDLWAYIFAVQGWPLPPEVL